MSLPTTPKAIVGKAFSGALALVFRQLAVQAVNVLGGIFLARLLTPAEFGIYAIILFVLSFLNAFGGTGLAANLIRQATKPSDEDYRSIFTVQQLLVFAVVAVFWILASWITSLYGLPPSTVWLFRLVALSLVATSFMVIPQVRLERELEFGRLAVIEALQAFVYNALAVFLAWQGLGALALAVALLARSVVGAILANLVSPWRLGWAWDWERASRHLRFGLPFQGISAVSLLKDSITPVLVGLLVGMQEVGYLNWAGMVAAYTLLTLRVLKRIYMPAFARMSEHGPQLKRFVEQIIWATNAVTAPIACLLLALIEPITRIVFGEVWLAALPYFYLLWAANLFVPTVAPLMEMLNALGDSRTTFGFAVLWMASTWLLGLPLVLAYGALGFALANLGVQLTNFWVFRVARMSVPVSIWKSISPAWGVGLVTAGLVYGCLQVWTPDTVLDLLGYGFLGGVTYLAGLALIHPEKTRWVWNWLRESMEPRLSVVINACSNRGHLTCVLGLGAA